MTITTKAPQRLLVLLLVVVVASFLLLASAVRAGGGPEATAPYTVQAGDTLWDIAATATADGGDVRGAVHDLRRLNGLDGSVIVPGQVIRVPTG